jgi:hypothetical protein
MASGTRIQQVDALVVWQGVSPGLIGRAFVITGAIAGGQTFAARLFAAEPHNFMNVRWRNHAPSRRRRHCPYLAGESRGQDSTRIGIARRMTCDRSLGGWP